MSVVYDSGFYSTPKKMNVRRCASDRFSGKSPYSSPNDMLKSSSIPFSLDKSPRRISNIGLKEGDRFIPVRSPSNIDYSSYSILKECTSSSSLETSPAIEKYKSKLSECLFENDSGDSLPGSPTQKILTFSQKVPTPGSSEKKAKSFYKSTYINSKSTPSRTIPSSAEKILDAPDILDDYYLNLLDWSSTNVIGIALADSVYLWNASNSEITKLTTVEPDNIITSLSFSESGQYISVGTHQGEVQLWDVNKCKKVRVLKGHLARVSSLSWNNQIVSSGSRDSTILNHDVRMSQHIISTFNHHTQEVCGLKWSLDGSQLASGGNDNILNIWSLDSESPVHTFTQHQAGVKALAWCPWQKNVLASGGGSVDRMIRFWNTSTGVCLNSVDTQSQVCSILWSKHYKELVSSHGYSNNQLTVWKYPSMKKQIDLSGHTSRVLYMAMSPDGSTVASAAPDETLRFWKIFDVHSNKSKRSSGRFQKEQGKMRFISIR